MKVKDIMTQDPVCCTPENTLVDAAKMMKDCDCGALPVIENEANRKPLGILTDRDIVIRGLAEGLAPDRTRVEACMTRSLVTVEPDDDLETCMQLMQKNKLRRILVLDNQGSVIGLVAQAQIARHADEEESGQVVRDISQPGS